MLRKGEWVWVDSDTGVPIGARVKVTPSDQRLLVDDEGKEQSLSQEQEASLKIMHPTSVEGVEDMIKLGDMNEGGLLRNLLLRHKQGNIYTYTGSVLVAVNPYQDYPIYSDEQVRLYQGRKLGELPPHIFGIAESCHSNMRRHLRNQCCIISGESGAGKTESTKLILQYLAAVSGERSEQMIEQQILESNPILEAFGNAKTVRNDNSSRFGKYLEIFFNKDGVIEGARVEQYLLEKSRVCHQAQEERNYHMFYCLLAGVSEKEKNILSLGKAEEYRFLTKGGCIKCEGRDDAKDYKRICSAMKILTFSEKQCQEIFKLLAAILHLGNVSFEANTQDNLETSNVNKSEHFSITASLLEVQKLSLADNLTHRSFMTNREKVTKPLSSEQASDCRDAFVKAIYNKLFIWIVEKINSVIHKTLIKSPKSSYLSIGLLDIFGFENFSTNSFEQLCINFANEKLQQFFVAHIFKLEQKEYLKEDIVWKDIKFSDNQNILDLLAGQSCNLLALIDEESNFPKGTDSTMLNKMNQQHRGNKSYIASRSEHDTDFGIRHFAGVVYYDADGFLEKNRDAISTDLLKMIDGSTNKLLRQIFESELTTNGVKIKNNNKVIMTPKSSLRAKTEGRKQMPTLSGQFRQSLDSLMKALSTCQPFFIRCFKPNNHKQSKFFDRELCMRQLRYSGMMDTIRIRNLGYPIRHTFVDFLKRYRVLLKTTDCNPKTKSAAACCEAICRSVIQGEDEWKIGRTKIFLKDTHDAFLERLREEELSRKAVVIQRVMMGHKDRRTFLKKRKAVLVLQRNWRIYRKKAERKLQSGYERLTARIRSRKVQFHFQKQREAAIMIQSQIRGHKARKEFKLKKEATIMLQAYARGTLVRMGAVKRRKVKADTESEEESSNTPENSSSPEEAEEEDQADMALELKKRLDDIARFEEPEKSDEEDSEESSDERSQTPTDERKNLFKPKEDTSPQIIISTVSESTTPSPSELTEEDEDDRFDEDDEFSFQRFIFQGGATHKHVTQRIMTPLLAHDDERDSLACLSVFWIILRYMGDLPEPKALDAMSQASSNVSSPLLGRGGRRLSSLVGLDQIILRRKTKQFGRKTSTILEESEDLTEDEDVLIGESRTLQRTLTSQEKLNIIIGYALSRPGIRDEIYCQICKQLVDNRNRRSRILGWTLLSICLGIFPPTDHFMKYLENFVRKGPNGFDAYCSERLKRIKVNGERKELPCWMEVKAAESKEPLNVSVTLMDDRSISLSLDPASTSAEACQAVAEQIGLRDTYGFSLYITMSDKMWSLGSCENHVFDAVSQCDQEIRRQGGQEKDAPWSLSIRKEMFTPWHDCSKDWISTDLIYRQIVKGVKSGEYSSDKDDDYVQIAAQHYYIRFGSILNENNVQKVVQECISITLIESKSMRRWIQLISTAVSQGTYADRKQTADSVKGDLVNSAMESWPIFFSKFYDVTMLSGPSLAKSRFFVAVNWRGVLFMDGKDKRLLELPYIEIKEAFLTSEDNFTATMSLPTFRGEYVLKSAKAKDMAALIEKNLEGLRQRSEYAIVMNDSNHPGFLVCKRGDLLLVKKEEDYPPKDKRIRANNQRTKISGDVHLDSLEFLPTLSAPSQDIVLLRMGKISVSADPRTEESVATASLREFSKENFRSAGKDAGRPGSRGGTKERLWASSKEPLKQPLLKILTRNSDLSSLACVAFTAILKYMGDYPIKQARSPLELTDQIFGAATEYEALQDEIYCQIMKQMTNNPNRLSTQRGWQLMWLCTGLFPPSPLLLKHTQRFLETRPREPLSDICLQRIKEMLRKEPRKLPPHFVEVEAIQQNSTVILQKVHFPNDTNELYQVASTTTIRELSQDIAALLKLSSNEGYGLYLKTQQKTICMDEDKYFFDSLRQALDAPKKQRKVKDGSQTATPSLVIFRRKLWFNVSPGKDLIADLTFHFPQEMAKYLKGYHNCTKEDMITLAGLLFRTQVDSDRSQFIMIPKMLKNLVPDDQIKRMSPDEWKKHIISSYNKQSGITVEEAKIAFLNHISSWPTFGCAFFSVKQTCESDYPKTLWIAVSKQGVSLIDPENKELVVMHPFNRILEFTSKGKLFQMVIRTVVQRVIFYCETSQPEMIEDLMRSYVDMYEQQTLPRTHLVFF